MLVDKLTIVVAETCALEAALGVWMTVTETVVSAVGCAPEDSVTVS